MTHNNINFDMQVMKPAEHKYTFAQSHQLNMQTGLIGYLRAYFDSGGGLFYSDWNDIRTSLKTEAFKAEFDDIINSLRSGENFLANRNFLARFCYTTPESSYKDGWHHYGMRIDTNGYTYLLRLNPNKNEYNLYCYCYEKEHLETHIKNAERGIRFIDSHYRELFRIPDGAKVKITYPGKAPVLYICRYIDSYHLEVGSNLYHSCEFAEIMERNGAKVEPEKEPETIVVKPKSKDNER